MQTFHRNELIPSARAEHRRILVIPTEQIGFVELIDSTLHIQRNTMILYSVCLSDPILKKLAIGFLGTKLNDFCSLELDGWIVGLKCQSPVSSAGWAPHTFRTTSLTETAVWMLPPQVKVRDLYKNRSSPTSSPHSDLLQLVT